MPRELIKPYLHTQRPVNDVTEGSTQEAPMGASQRSSLNGLTFCSFQLYICSIRWVLPECFLLCASSRKHLGSTQHYLLMAWNSHQVGNLSRKHTWVLPGCFPLRVLQTYAVNLICQKVQHFQADSEYFGGINNEQNIFFVFNYQNI